MPLDDIMRKVDDLGVRHVTVTGGEPLAQTNVLQLMQRLADASFSVSVETSGALSVEHIPAEVVKGLDLKTPGSRESHRGLLISLVVWGTKSSPEMLSTRLMLSRVPISFLC